MLRALPSFARRKNSSIQPELLDDSVTTSSGSRNDQQNSGFVTTFESLESKPVVDLPAIQPTSRDVDSVLPTPKLRLASGKVADRIRSINDLHRSSATLATASAHAPTPYLRHDVSASATGRAIPFFRRDAAEGPVGTHPPLVQPRYPTAESYVHSPMPQRYQPGLSRSIEQGLDTSTSSNVPTGFENPTTTNTSTSKWQSTSHFKPVPEPEQSRDQVVCPRHGRHLASRKGLRVTTNAGLEKSISGAYIPIGQKLRHQVDALSPWALLGRHVAKQEGTVVSPEACPDCIAEQDILIRELSTNATTDEDSRDISNCVSAALPSSTLTEPGTPLPEGQPNVLIGSANDHQMAALPGASLPDPDSDDIGYIVAADLGDMLEAIIIEHSGTLDKVITNIRDSIPQSLRMQALSQDLAKVSSAFADLPEQDMQNAQNSLSDTEYSAMKRSVVLDAAPDLLRKRTRSIPQLLELIDATAEHLGLEMKPNGSSGQRHSSPPNANANTDTALETVSVRRASGRTLLLPGGLEPIVLTPVASTFQTPVPSPEASQEPAISEDTASRLASSAPDLERTDATRLPSEVLRSQDLTPLPCLTSNSATPRNPQFTPSRLPRTVLAPYQSGLKGSRSSVKPSDVIQRQKQQGTFRQEWLRETSRASSSAERAGRRSKVQGTN